MPASPTARVRWRNWAGNQRAEVVRVHPGSVVEVAEILAGASASE